MSSLSLVTQATKSLTPGVELDDPFNNPAFGPDSRRNSRVQLALPNDARKLLHSDADVPEWGSDILFYNQPRSRARPLPSRSVTNLNKLHKKARDDLEFAARKATSPPPGTASSAAGEYDEWKIVPALRGNGALINAINAAKDEKAFDVSWVGTLGFPTDALPQNTKLKIQDDLANDFEEEVVFVSDQNFSGHYTNFCKIVLWPLFHYQVPDDVNSKAYMDRSWEYYYNVNRAFADQLIKSYKRGDTIWVHDYHLLLVPSMVRKQLPDAKIGLFLHTAFPSSEIFRCQTKYRDLLHGMLGANLVAFQLQEYVSHFLQTCSRFLRIETTSEGVQLEDRFVNVTKQPIGINPTEIEKIRYSEAFAQAVEDVETTFKGKKLIVSRDKLDRIHGVRQKFQAYERFLDEFPDRAKDTVLLQVLSPNHEPNADLYARISEIQNRIHRKHHKLDQQPLRIWEQDLTPEVYYAILTVGDVLMNATQRDGMNLTAHEFVFCQDGKVRNHAHGAAVLSEFAGCSDILESGILRINPWNIPQQAAAISDALSMDPESKKAHWMPLHKIVQELTGAQWFQGLTRSLNDAHRTQDERSAASVPRLQTSAISHAYDQASHRLFILDYEGTLIARQSTASGFLTSPHRVIDILMDLLMDPKNVVYVTSDSSHQQLSQIFQTANGVGLIAENGSYMLPHGETYPQHWKTAINEDATAEWKSDVRGILTYFQARLEGSAIEERGSTMFFYFNDVKDQKIAERLSGDCADQINGSCQAAHVRAVHNPEYLKIEQTDCNKGTMASTLFNILHDQCARDKVDPPDFLMVAGDDREDEAVFRWANDLAKDGIVRDVFTVSIGDRETEAKAAMSKGSAGLLSVLSKLAQSSLADRPVKNPAKKVPSIL